MNRGLWWAVLVIGIALIVMPLAISLPSKSSAGQDMIDNFNPIMQPASVEKTVDYYDNTFTPLGEVAVGARQVEKETPQLMQALAVQLGMTPKQVQQFLGTEFPATAGLLQSLPQLDPVFAGVPPGLDHYRPLVDTMETNVGNYDKIDSLPNFRLFTWFFVVPGVLLVVLAGWSLVSGRRTAPAGVTAPAA